MPRRNTSPTPDVWLALFGVYLVWGSTYLAIRYAVSTFPPFLMAGSRFLLSGILLYGFTRLRGVPRPTFFQWKSASVVGFLLVFCSNGGVSWAEREVPSGISALLVATVPLWMTVGAWVWKKGKKPNSLMGGGLLLGMAGVAVLAVPGFSNPGKSLAGWGTLVLILTPVSWAIGSIYTQDADLPSSPFLSTAMEMLAGGIFQLIGAFILGEGSRFHLSQISTASWEAWAYLTLVGSLVGFTSYIWVLHKSTPALASTYAFVNPVIAVFLGWALAGEALTINVFIATSLIVAAVILITRQTLKRD
jgi:drug/metabolite transporter (DMT)-like permease